MSLEYYRGFDMKEAIMNRFVKYVCVAALTVGGLVWTPAHASAQKPVTKSAEVSKTFTIVAIDQSSRLVTLRDDQGVSETIACGPEVKRFDALKVGDKVTFRYHESLVHAIRKAGAPAAPSAGAAITRAPGDKPGGTISAEMTATVTINAIDPAVPSVGITTSDGRKMSFKVEDRKNLEGVKVGDQVEITYTQALAVSVSAPGK